jgi:hypothetical protein
MATTPRDRTDEYKHWHKFLKGMCLYCGWFCIDCPKDVATCKCNPPKAMSQEERADQLLRLENSGITDSWSE